MPGTCHPLEMGVLPPFPPTWGHTQHLPHMPAPPPPSPLVFLFMRLATGIRNPLIPVSIMHTCAYRVSSTHAFWLTTQIIVWGEGVLAEETACAKALGWGKKMHSGTIRDTCGRCGHIPVFSKGILDKSLFSNVM